MCADECTSRQLRVSFARLLIEIDVTKPLLHSVSIETPGGVMLEQKVVYEWTPPFCSKCNKVGHDCSKSTTPPIKLRKCGFQRKLLLRRKRLLQLMQCLLHKFLKQMVMKVGKK